jgi:hypothetical protein
MHAGTQGRGTAYLVRRRGGLWVRRDTANDVFVLSYSNKTTMEISKAQLVAFLTDEDASGLVNECTWQLRSRLINFELPLCRLHRFHARCAQPAGYMYPLQGLPEQHPRHLRHLKEPESHAARAREAQERRVVRTRGKYEYEKHRASVKAARRRPPRPPPLPQTNEE